jgi:hypothetical protein
MLRARRIRSIDGQPRPPPDWSIARHRRHGHFGHQNKKKKKKKKRCKGPPPCVLLASCSSGGMRGETGAKRATSELRVESNRNDPIHRGNHKKSPGACCCMRKVRKRLRGTRRAKPNRPMPQSGQSSASQSQLQAASRSEVLLFNTLDVTHRSLAHHVALQRSNE